MCFCFSVLCFSLSCIDCPVNNLALEQSSRLSTLAQRLRGAPDGTVTYELSPARRASL